MKRSGYVPDRGDIIHMNFDPSLGTEMKGRHYAFVVTTKEFNRRGLAWVCPISQGIGDRYIQQDNPKMSVSLINSGVDTSGRIFCQQMRVIDWRERRVSLKERSADYIVDEVISITSAILLDGYE